MIEFETFVAGAVTFGFVVAGLFFAHFWSRTHDRMFLALAAAFTILAAAQVPLARFGIVAEGHIGHYVLRMIAYCVIIGAIVDKNVHFRDRP